MALAPSIVINLPGYPFETFPSVQTIAALRALPSAGFSTGDNYVVDGGAAAGDGGGGTFAWNDASVAADDGATIIRPDDTSSGQAGRWVLTGKSGLADRPTFADLAAPEGAGSIGYGATESYPAGSIGSAVQNIGLDVYRFIPSNLHSGIRNNTNSADLAPYLQDWIDTCADEGRTAIWSAGKFLIDSPVLISNKAVQFECAGYNAGPAPDSGTWIIQKSTGFSPFEITGVDCRGTQFKNGIGVWQQQPGPGGGWVPADYDYVFDIHDTYGEVLFDDLYLCGVTKGLNVYNAPRLEIGMLRGQVFEEGLRADEIMDVMRIKAMQMWIYSSTADSIVQYSQANANCILLGRTDIPFFGDLFSFGYRSLLKVFKGTPGGLPANRVHITKMMADFTKYALEIDADVDDVTMEIGQLDHHGNSYPIVGLDAIPDSNTIMVRSDGNRLAIGSFRSDLIGESPVKCLGENNRIDVAQFRAAAWGRDTGTEPCFYLENSGGLPNIVTIANTPFLERSGTEPVKNSGTNGVVYRNGAGQTGLVEGVWTEWNAGESRINQKPDGLAASISHNLESKGTGSHASLAPEGIETIRASLSKGIEMRPVASVTPANNGDMVFEATSNTQVKIKLKGSDGVVRAGSITLS